LIVFQASFTTDYLSNFFLNLLFIKLMWQLWLCRWDLRQVELFYVYILYYFIWIIEFIAVGVCFCWGWCIYRRNWIRRTRPF